jgi:uncharacterized protein (UPF0276 family)
MARNRWNYPDLGLGVGLRTAHFAHILAERPGVGFFEVLTENFLDTGGRPVFILDQIAERSPLVMHGVSPIALENPPTYLEFTPSAMTEWEFIARLAEEADCGLLFDVNNVYVPAFNHGYDPRTYIDAIPAERVCQYHLAGHTHKGTHILDTHSDHVVDPVWELFGRTIRHVGLRATLLEWDESIPPFEVVHAEVQKARVWREEEVGRAA